MELEHNETLALGRLINEIEACGTKASNGEPKTIRYDFGTAIPTFLDSYRGYYDQLALGYELTGYDNEANHMKQIKAQDLLDHLKEAIGKTYTGWKGGEFQMDENTPVWVSNAGNADSTGIIGVADNEYELILITAYCN